MVERRAGASCIKMTIPLVLAITTIPHVKTCCYDYVMPMRRSLGSDQSRSPMTRTQTPPFNPHKFLRKVGRGKTILPSPNKHTIFSQGDAADAVFYIQAGKVKLTVVSEQGEDAVADVW